MTRSRSKGIGENRPAMVCPHCQTRGRVYVRPEREKAGVSGGKAAVAVLTGGVSVLATGLSRRVNVLAAYCGACSTHWVIR